jgi:hypothetical protein
LSSFISRYLEIGLVGIFYEAIEYYRSIAYAAPDLLDKILGITVPRNLVDAWVLSFLVTSSWVRANQTFRNTSVSIASKWFSLSYRGFKYRDFTPGKSMSGVRLFYTQNRVLTKIISFAVAISFLIFPIIAFTMLEIFFDLKATRNHRKANPNHLMYKNREQLKKQMAALKKVDKVKAKSMPKMYNPTLHALRNLGLFARKLALVLLIVLAFFALNAYAPSL